MSNLTSTIARFFGFKPETPASETIVAASVKPSYATSPLEEAYVARIKAAHPGATIAWSRSSIGGLQADVLGVGRYACSRWSSGVQSDAYMD